VTRFSTAGLSTAAAYPELLTCLPDARAQLSSTNPRFREQRADKLVPDSSRIRIGLVVNAQWLEGAIPSCPEQLEFAIFDLRPPGDLTRACL
jgi:hypothetical protein